MFFAIIFAIFLEKISLNLFEKNNTSIYKVFLINWFICVAISVVGWLIFDGPSYKIFLPAIIVCTYFPLVFGAYMTSVFADALSDFYIASNWFFVAIIICALLVFMLTVKQAFMPSISEMTGFLILLAILTGKFLSSSFIYKLINKEVPQTWLLRNWALFCASLGGSNFRGAKLNHALFFDAILQNTCLIGATLDHACWREAHSLNLANTYGTVLGPKIVRDTLISGNGSDKHFVGLDLHGLDFSGMNLAKADFTGANLSGASFANADLRNAKLTRAVLLGADLSRTKLTGAYIGHWNIDKHTCFEGIECEYVYLDEIGENRQPESGEFRPGEFEKLYQEIAHTVDIIIEGPAQMDALLCSLAEIRTRFGKDAAQIQKVERKGDALKVSVEVPPEQEELLRKEIRREYETQLLEQQHKYALLQKDLERAQSERDLVREGKDEIKALIGTFVPLLKRPNETIINIKATAVNNRSSTISGSNITNSSINQGGDHVEQHNETHAGLPATEISSLLEQLRGLIGQSDALPEAMKANALQQVETLRQAAAKPPAEAKTAAIAPLEALKMVGTLAGGIGSLMGAVAKLFGLEN